MENKLEKAREIFINGKDPYFAGPHGSWQRAYEEYKSYGISEEIEKEWLNDFIEQNYNEYKGTSKFKYLDTIVHYKRYDLLQKIFSIDIKGTLINRLVVAELLTKFILENECNIKNHDFEKYRNIIFKCCDELEKIIKLGKYIEEDKDFAKFTTSYKEHWRPLWRIGKIREQLTSY